VFVTFFQVAPNHFILHGKKYSPLFPSTLVRSVFGLYVRVAIIVQDLNLLLKTNYPAW